MNGRHSLLGLSLLSIGAVLCGCSADATLPPDMPPLNPVTLTILQEGKPLSYASVRLIPAEGNSPWSSGGSTDESGVATIRTHGKYLGVPSGKYKVTVSKIETTAKANASDDALRTERIVNDTTYDLVSPQYSYPNQTPLLLDVTTGDNYQELELGPAVRIKRQGPPS